MTVSAHVTASLDNADEAIATCTTSPHEDDISPAEVAGVAAARQAARSLVSSDHFKDGPSQISAGFTVSGSELPGVARSVSVNVSASGEPAAPAPDDVEDPDAEGDED